MSAAHVGGTHGPGIVSSAAGVFGGVWCVGCEELVEYVRGVFVWLGAARVERGGGRLRRLGLSFTNPVGTGGVLDVCMCFGCGGVGGVGG